MAFACSAYMNGPAAHKTQYDMEDGFVPIQGQGLSDVHFHGFVVSNNTDAAVTMTFTDENLEVLFILKVPARGSKESKMEWFVSDFGLNVEYDEGTDGDQVRDMLYVEDLVKAYDAYVQTKIYHSYVWNIGGGPENILSLNEHLGILRAHTRFRSEVKYEDWRPLDQKCYISDIRSLKQTLGWEPTVRPYDGLLKTLDWVEQNLEVF